MYWLRRPSDCSRDRDITRIHTIAFKLLKIAVNYTIALKLLKIAVNSTALQDHCTNANILDCPSKNIKYRLLKSHVLNYRPSHVILAVLKFHLMADFSDTSHLPVPTHDLLVPTSSRTGFCLQLLRQLPCILPFKRICLEQLSLDRVIFIFIKKFDKLNGEVFRYLAEKSLPR